MIICHTADDPSAIQQTFHNIWRLLNVLHHQEGETLDGPKVFILFTFLRHLTDTVLQLVLLPLHRHWIGPAWTFQKQRPWGLATWGATPQTSPCVLFAVLCFTDSILKASVIWRESERPTVQHMRSQHLMGLINETAHRLLTHWEKHCSPPQSKTSNVLLLCQDCERFDCAAEPESQCSESLQGDV